MRSPTSVLSLAVCLPPKSTKTVVRGVPRRRRPSLCRRCSMPRTSRRAAAGSATISPSCVIARSTSVIDVSCVTYTGAPAAAACDSALSLVVEGATTRSGLSPSRSATATLEATTGASSASSIDSGPPSRTTIRRGGEGIVSDRSAVVIGQGKELFRRPDGLAALAATDGDEAAGQDQCGTEASEHARNRSRARATVSAHELGGAVPASPRKPRSDDVARAIYRRRVRRNGKAARRGAWPWCSACCSSSGRAPWPPEP